MYSLERLFYSVSALLGLMAIVLFGMFFDIGDMVLAAFRAPGAFSEFQTQRGIRTARKWGIPDEILPDGSKKPIGWSEDDPHGLNKLSGPARLFARPFHSMEGSLKRTRLMLAQQGFTDDEFIEMESYYRVDRGHNGELVGIERLMARGNHMEALDRLDALLATIEPRNKRAIEEMLMIKLRLAVQLEAPPEELYDLIMQRLELLKEISDLEVRGYRNIPRFAAQYARVLAKQKGFEEQIRTLQNRRSQAFAVLQSGLPFGQFPPSMARMMKAAIQRDGKAKGVPRDQIQHYIDWVDTRTKSGGG